MKNREHKAKGVESRKLALEVLLRTNEEKSYVQSVLSASLKESKLSSRDKAFVTYLVQGVLRNLSVIDKTIKAHSHRPIEKMTSVLLNVLRLGTYQLLFMEDMPASAVLSTSTSVARLCGHSGLSSFTQGVLRNILRNLEKIRQEHGIKQNRDLNDHAFVSKDPEELSDHYSMPLWIVRRWLDTYGLEITISLLAYSQSSPKQCLRINENAVEVKAVLSILERAGLEVEASNVVPSCVRILSKGKFKGPLEKLPGYSEGLFSIQDEASQLVSFAVGAKAGDLVIDLCAAPGGKTLHMSEMMQNKGKILAVDKSEQRLSVLKNNRQRLSITNVEVIEGDGRNLKLDTKADRVLVDAPCSGTGVLNRRSDLRYHRREEDIKSLAELQWELLVNAADLVKPGGVLVYSTCSVEKEENDQIVDKFLEQYKDFEYEPLTKVVQAFKAPPFSLEPDVGKIQLLPTMQGFSGFFLARFRRKEQVSST